jgi:hypothetical protein
MDLIIRFFQDLAPSMTLEQIVQVADLAHVADMAIDLEEAAAARTQMEADAQRPETERVD